MLHLQSVLTSKNEMLYINKLGCVTSSRFDWLDIESCLVINLIIFYLKHAKIRILFKVREFFLRITDLEIYKLNK